MSTTTIRLPPELRKRVARAAERAGTSAHSFILEAIAEKTSREEIRSEFRETAERRYATILASGGTISWNEMRKYLRQRAAGKQITRPKPAKPSR
jgi:uncharacterized protein (DUF1778 family)